MFIFKDAWVITGGINLGCMKLAGEVFKESEFFEEKKPVVLGIANWSTIRGNDSLITTKVIFKLYYIKFKEFS